MSIGIKNAACPLRLRSCPQMYKIRYSAEQGTGPTNPSNYSHKKQGYFAQALLKVWIKKPGIF